MAGVAATDRQKEAWAATRGRAGRLSAASYTGARKERKHARTLVVGCLPVQLVAQPTSLNKQ